LKVVSGVSKVTMTCWRPVLRKVTQVPMTSRHVASVYTATSSQSSVIHK